MNKYISDLDEYGQTIDNIISQVEQIIVIPLAINHSLQNVETEVLTQYSKLVDMQIREASSKSL